MPGSKPSLSSSLYYVQYELFNSPPLIKPAPQAVPPDVLARHAHGVHSVQLGQHFVPYQLQRSKRRSIGFQITTAGLRITAPHRMSLAEIHAAILSKERWILKNLQDQRDRISALPEPPVAWNSGATLLFLGQLVTLHVRYGAPTQFNPQTGIITLNLPTDSSPALIKKHLLAWLMNQARKHFSERLPYYAERLDVQYHSFALSSASTQWGSCNVHGKIRLNWRLIHFSSHLIDYVIAHELAHLLEMNHSPRFWARVKEVFPDYLNARAELNKLALSVFTI